MTVARVSNNIYDDNKTMRAIYFAQSEEIELLTSEVRQDFDNRFFATMDAPTIAKYEGVFDIIASGTEPLEYRRARILALISFRAPFTRVWLEQTLYSAFEDRAKVAVDVQRFGVTFSLRVSESAEESAFRDFIAVLTPFLPANMEVMATFAETLRIPVYIGVNISEKFKEVI
jgi:hypothetical protein